MEYFSLKENFYIKQAHSKEINCLDFRIDGKFFVTGGNDNLIKVWSVMKGTMDIKIEGHTDYVTSVAFSPSA